MKIYAAGIALEGESVSGIGTCIAVPQYDIVFDVGICPKSAAHCRNVLITHSHIDHIGSAHIHAALRSLNSMSPTRFFVPPSVVEKFTRMMKMWAEIQHDEEIPCEIIPLACGEEYMLKKGVYIRPFATDHRIDSQGYCIVEKRNKLRSEFAGMPVSEIARARKSGDVTESVDFLQIVYTGDTRASIWDSNKEISSARVIITESTYICNEKIVKDAHKWGHTHINEIIDVLKRGVISNAETEALVITHFSSRYTSAEIDRWISNINNAVAVNVLSL